MPSSILFLLSLLTRAGQVLALVLLSALLGCSDKAALTPGAGGVKTRPVIAAQVAVSPEQINIETVANSRALHSVALRSRAAGYVAQINVKPGEKVERGQLLLQLDDRDELLALRKAAVELADAERLLARYRQSQQSGAVTQAALDDAESAAARAQIAVERARLNVEYQKVLAPFSGYVGLSDIDPGAWLDNNTVIATLDDRSVLLVTFVLPELLLGQVEIGQALELSTWRKDLLAAKAEVITIDSRVDEQERTFKLRAQVDNSADVLRPGMSFRIALSLIGNDYALVPEVSLQWGAQGSFVWTVVDGRAERRLASIVQRRAGQVLLDGDLQEGTLVVLEGIQMMREGQPVEVTQVRQLAPQPLAVDASVELSGPLKQTQNLSAEVGGE